jgi:hypothetical protein
MGSSGNSQKREAERLRNESRAMQESALRELEGLSIPDIEKMKIQMQMMSDAGFINTENMEIGEQISTDPMLREAQLAALSDLRERGQSGLTEEDKAMQNLMLRDVAAQEQSQQKGILQGMAERGTLDSGAQLAAQLSSQQGSYNRAYDQAQKNAIAAAQAKREAVSQAGSLSRNMQQDDLARMQFEKNREDAIKKFNIQNSMEGQKTNLGIRQDDIGLRNQEQMYNKELFQQDYQNQVGLATTKSNARLGQAQRLQNEADAYAQAAAKKRKGFGTMVGAIAGGAIGSVVPGAGTLAGAQLGASLGGSYADGGVAYASDNDLTDLPITEFDRREQEQAVDENRLLKELEMLYNNKLQNGGIAYKDGGCTTRAEDGSLMYESEGDIVGGDSYAGDRVDAKLNSGEVVLNAPQQQRLMDVIRGEEDLTALGDEDIIEGVPESYRNKLHGKQDKKQQMSKGFQRLLEMLGK